MDDQVISIFNAATSVVVANVKRVFFWKDKWLNGKYINQMAPDVPELITPTTRAKRTVVKALKNCNLLGGMWYQEASIYSRIHASSPNLGRNQKLQSMPNCQHTADEWIRLWESKGVHSAKLVYKGHFARSIKCDPTGNLGFLGATLV
jgi:hypothetical protein